MAPITTPRHEIIGAEPSPAKEAGSLDGWAAVCSCGTRIESSLIECAMSWGRDHAHYYNQKEGK